MCHCNQWRNKADVLQTQSDALKQWLPAEGDIQIEYEVPIQKRDVSGAGFNGIINLLATCVRMCLILGHKSGAGSFAGYFAQLQAYQKFLHHANGTYFVEIAVHSIDRAAVEVIDESIQAELE